MNIDRRSFLHMAAGAALVNASPEAPLPGSGMPSRFRAIAFDAFPIFDPRPVAALAESLLPGKSEELMSVWRDRQFEYQWLRALAGQYADFVQATRDSLMFAARRLGLNMSPAVQEQLLAAWSSLPVWPDVSGTLDVLRGAGLRLALLSNMTREMLAGGLRAAALDRAFEAVISTGQIRSYKPDPRAYQLGMDALKLHREEILFVAFAGWDAAGAKWFGYPAFWVNRMNAPQEALGVTPDGVGHDLAALVRFVLPGRAAGNT
jgi:2-haloacid dehalogenase